MAKISDQDVQDVFDSLKKLNNDELKELSQRIDARPHPAATHLAAFVRGHITKAPRRDPFKGVTAQVQQLFDQSKEQAR